uniref:Bcl-2-related protein A1 n=1 Tax=Equus asinus TaxID=9793 RepID=A0A8C4PQL1_EQUAS
MTDCEFGYIHMLAQDYLKYVLQIPQPGSGPSKTSRVLQDIAFSVQNEVEKNLKPCLDNFHVVSIDAARTIFNQVMEKQFEDGIINWGRIMTIFAFEGILIKKLLPERIAPDVDTYKEISYFVAEFITKNTGEWIRQNGGWALIAPVLRHTRHGRNQEHCWLPFTTGPAWLSGLSRPLLES